MDNPPTVIITTPQPQPQPQPPPPPPQPFFPSSPPYPHPDNNTTTVSSPPAPLPFTSSSSPQTQIYPITIVTINQPPPFPDSPRSVDLSPLVFILALLAVITIPALIYVFFFAVKCPSWSSSSSSSSSDRHTRDDDDHSRIEIPVVRVTEPVSGLKYKKETHSKEIGNECPVCLSVFTDGEEVKLLSRCKHSFHTTCIDLWLTNHNNCPICRADVDVNRQNNNRGPPSGSTRDGGDHHQGLPDASSLV